MPASEIPRPDWLLQMESVLDTLNEGVLIMDDNLSVVYVNSVLLEWVGYQREEVLGRTPFFFFPAQDFPYMKKQRAQAERNRQHRHEFYVPRKDGGKMPSIISGRLIAAPDGQQYSVVTIVNISEQKFVEQQLREANLQLEQRQKEIEDELALAERVQQSLAPRSLLWGRIAVEAYYSPVHTVGGDFGLVLPHSDEVLSLLVCDVSGHGIGSALVANRIYSETLHELEGNIGLGGLLQRLHGFVHEHIGVEGFYFTMAAGRFVQQGRHMTFASAGHPPTMLVSDGTLRRLESQSGVLGCLLDTAPSGSAEEIDLTPGDRLVLYTDGFIEVFNQRDEMLGIEGLEDLIRRSAKRTLPDMKQAILQGVAAWRHGPLTDDMSLVLVEIR